MDWSAVSTQHTEFDESMLLVLAVGRRVQCLK
jgi:hypothetical protein